MNKIGTIEGVEQELEEIKREDSRHSAQNEQNQVNQGLKKNLKLQSKKMNLLLINTRVKLKPLIYCDLL